jgi:hypothetical protein
LRSRAILTVAAASAAAIGGGLATAGTAAATTAPLTTKATPTAAPPTPGVLAVENALQLGDGWCVAPLHWSGSVIANPFPSSSDACGQPRKDDDGVHVLSNLCIAPISTDDPRGSPAAPPGCDQGAAGPGFEILRNVSVAGVRATF